MPPSRTTPRKGAKFLDAKLLIVSLSLAITIGFWNLFSNNAIQSAQSANADSAAEASAPPADVSAGGPPLPTLVPLVSVSLDEANPGAAAAPAQGVGQGAPLRAVAVPTLQIVQKHNPIIGQTTVQTSSGDNGGGGGGGGGSQPAPAASTRTSK